MIRVISTIEQEDDRPYRSDVHGVAARVMLEAPGGFGITVSLDLNGSYFVEVIGTGKVNVQSGRWRTFPQAGG